MSLVWVKMIMPTSAEQMNNFSLKMMWITCRGLLQSPYLKSKSSNADAAQIPVSVNGRLLLMFTAFPRLTLLGKGTLVSTDWSSRSLSSCQVEKKKYVKKLATSQRRYAPVVFTAALSLCAVITEHSSVKQCVNVPLTWGFLETASHEPCSPRTGLWLLTRGCSEFDLCSPGDSWGIISSVEVKL